MTSVEALEDKVKTLEDKVDKRAVRDRIRYTGQKKDIERSLVSLTDKIQGINLAMGTTVADRVSVFYKAAFSALLVVIAISLGIAVFIATEFHDVDNQYEQLTSEMGQLTSEMGQLTSKLEQLTLHIDDRFSRLETMSQSQSLKVLSTGNVSSEKPADTAN